MCYNRLQSAGLQLQDQDALLLHALSCNNIGCSCCRRIFAAFLQEAQDDAAACQAASETVNATQQENYDSVVLVLDLAWHLA